ncbi:MAG: MFS transporter, partial [Dehalococcoidia bacterium]
LLPDGKTKRGSVITRKDKGIEALKIKEWSSREALRTLAFWLLLAINVVIAAILYMVGIHIVAHATDVGIAATTATSIMIFMGGANILSKVVVGGIAVKIGSKLTLLLCLLLKAIALFSFTVIEDLWMFCTVAAILGFGFGGSAPLLASMVAEFFGVKSVGVIMGLTGVGWAAGCALGTVFGDYIFDVRGSYIIAFLVTGVVAMVAGMLVLLLRTPSKYSSGGYT